MAGGRSGRSGQAAEGQAVGLARPAGARLCRAAVPGPAALAGGLAGWRAGRALAASGGLTRPEKYIHAYMHTKTTSVPTKLEAASGSWQRVGAARVEVAARLGGTEVSSRGSGSNLVGKLVPTAYC